MKSQVLLNSQNAFPYFKDRTEYKAKTGQDAPDYNPERPIKKWFDPNAGEDGLPEVIYPNNIMTRADGTFVLKNGAPVTRPLVLSVEDAKTVNMPPEDPTGRTGVPANATEIASPFRDLGPDEVIVVGGAELGFIAGQQLVIRNVRLFAEEQAKQADESGKFTSADRALLKAIAAKLGV